MQQREEDWKERLAERLRERNRALGARLGKVEADRLRADGPLEADFEEQAVQRENDEVLDALDEVERGELERVRGALQRLESGRFGVCDGCDEEIAPARLEVIPESTLCVTCAKAEEARQG